jgi:hypothetical protein
MALVLVRRWSCRVKVNCGLREFTFSGPAGTPVLQTFLVLKQDQARFTIMAIGTEGQDFSEHVFRFYLFDSVPNRKLPEWMTGEYRLINSECKRLQRIFVFPGSAADRRRRACLLAFGNTHSQG